MKNAIENPADKLKEWLNKQSHYVKCVTCGSLCGIYSSDEGTSSYEPAELEKLYSICRKLLSACESISVYGDWGVKPLISNEAAREARKAIEECAKEII